MAHEISEKEHTVCGDDATEWSEENDTKDLEGWCIEESRPIKGENAADLSKFEVQAHV